MYKPSLGVVVIICMGLVGPAAAQTAPRSDLQAGTAAMLVAGQLKLFQLPVVIESIGELPVDEAMKTSARDAVREAQAQIHPLLEAAENDPKSVQDLVARGKPILTRMADRLRKLLTPQQYQSLIDRTRLIQQEMMALTLDSKSVDRLFNELRLSSEQREAVKPTVEQTTSRTTQLLRELSEGRHMSTAADEMVTVALDGRRRFRAVLTEEQRNQLDRQFSPAPTTAPTAPL